MFIEFSNVSMTYKPGIHALKNVSFKIEKGEFVFVIGRSGSGKSTIVKLLTCEERASSGRIYLENYDITDISRRDVSYLRRNIGMVFQDFRLIQSKTVYQNVAFAMEIIGFGKNIIKKRVPMVLSIVGLRNKSGMYPNQLSGGEQQRVAIARAMVNGAALIIADEPTGNLDPINSEAVMALLQEINDSGTTVVVCTHDATMVNKLKRRVIEISGGRLVRDEKLGEYNLSAEVRPGNRKDEEAAGSRTSGRKSGMRAKSIVDSPFVRNVDLKINDIGIDKDISDDSVPAAVDTEEEELIMSMVDKAAASVSSESDEQDTGKPEPDNSAEEALRIAVEYYMKKARKYQEHSGQEKKAEPVSDISDNDDFINLIKPKRIRPDDAAGEGK